jgi:NAD(P)-dependent dehydrogenase (short-subunit alcohol dehydrogenase family)
MTTGMALDPTAVSLAGKVAVVTGGGAGLGRGIAAGLAAFGAGVSVWERDAETCASAAEEVGGLAVVTDVREADQVDRAVAATLDRYGRIDVLVNNAGGVFRSSILDVSEKGIDALHRANLRHVILCTQRVGRVMVAAGRGGSIVNVASIEGVRAAPGYAAYAAAKAGVLNLTKTVALELAPHQIRVNALAPDITWTEGLARLAAASGDGRTEDERNTRTALTVPLGRLGHVDDIAGAAVFLASGLSTYVTGQTLHVDGGTSAAGGWYHHPDTGDYITGAP